MEKLFTNEQLDEALNALSNSKCAISFNGLSIEKQKYNDAIYRYLEGKGIVRIQEAGGHVICAALTDYGMTLSFEGQEKEDNKKLFKKFKFDIISVIVGTIVGYILGAVTVLLVK